MENKEEAVNSCLVCRTANQDGECEKLFLDDIGSLSASGRLYEELFELQIDVNKREDYPQYLCNSCDLQMRLFKKLKTKAWKTMEIFRERSKSILKNAVPAQLKIEVEDDTFEEQYLEEDGCISHNFQPPEATEDFALTDEELIDRHSEEVYIEEEDGNLQKSFVLDLETENVELEPNDGSCGSPLYETQIEFKEKDIGDISNPGNGTSIAASIETEEDSISSTNDNDSIYIDVHYLDENELAEKDDAELAMHKGKCTNVMNRVRQSTAKSFKCFMCSLEFNKSRDFKIHRRKVHFNKYPCPQCPKLFQTADALRVHTKLHQDLPAFKCDLCQKTFNQKVHYQYHMNRHNNVRDFKCEECGKAFLSKADLSVHLRTHTGDRRYFCEVCGKDFLLLQHLKMHRYSHSEKSFECEICKQKFISPSTLRTHMRSIHTTVPRFQCEFCVKRFRRKHHLTAHYKVHQRSKVDNYIHDKLNEESVDDYTADENEFHFVTEVEEVDGISIIDGEQYIIYNDTADNEKLLELT